MRKGSSILSERSRLLGRRLGNDSKRFAIGLQDPHLLDGRIEKVAAELAAISIAPLISLLPNKKKIDKPPAKKKKVAGEQSLLPKKEGRGRARSD